MKKLLFTAVSLVLLDQTTAQTVTWDTPITVAPGSLYSNVFPRLSMLTGNKPLVTWGGGGKVYSSVWNGSAFNAPLTLTPTGVVPYVQNWTGPEAGALGDTVFVTFGTSPITSSIVYTVRSTDGGLNFDDTVRVSTAGPGQARFPSVGVSAGGHPVVEYMLFDASLHNPEHTISKSTDAGSTYLAPVDISAISPGEVCDCCPGNMICSGNHHVALFRNAWSNIRTIYAASSDDASNTYPYNTEVDLTHWIVSSCPSSGPAGVIVGDTLITTWMSASKVYIGTMNIHDHQVGFNRQIFPGAGSRNYPRVAAKGDTVVVVWQSSIVGKPEVFISTSVTGAAGIGHYVDTVTTPFTDGQSRPDVKFSNRTIHLVYSDANGNDVKYLTGHMGGPVSVPEPAATPDIALVNARYSNGTLELLIETPAETGAQVQVVNAAGQTLASARLSLVKGRQVYRISCETATGMLAIQLLTDRGVERSIKTMAGR